MKLLDRYVVGSFLKNYLISFLVVVGMTVILDMILQLDELMKVVKGPNPQQNVDAARAVLVFIQTAGSYYFYQSFLYFAKMSGLIPVVAAAFTLLRMTRFNEVGAVLSSGVPAHRLAMPIIFAALALQGLLWVDQEVLIPGMISKLDRPRDYAVESDSFAIKAMRDGRDGNLFAAGYYPSADPPRMQTISVLYVGDDNRVTHIKASAATWDAAKGCWLLQDGSIEVIDPAERAAGVRATTRPVSVYQSDATPEEIRLYKSAESVEYLSTSRINELLQRPMSYGRNSLLRLKYSRGPAQIAVNMVVLLLALSSVLTRDPQHLMQAALKCAVLCMLCLGGAFGAQLLAGSPPVNPALADRWPAMMAWLPVFLFGPVAVVLLARVKT